MGEGGSSEGGWILDGFLKVKLKGFANKLDVGWEGESRMTPRFLAKATGSLCGVCLGRAVCLFKATGVVH